MSSTLKVGWRNSLHLEELKQGVRACGDYITSVDDTGCDIYVAWGWPQCQGVYQKIPAWRLDTARVLCVDAHPFALMPDARTGSRILQVDNWGALAAYPPGKRRRKVKIPASKAVKSGPILVAGQVYSAMQRAHGWVDAWHTGGYDEWVKQYENQPGYKFRPHPRTWASEKPQETLSGDLKGCSGVLTWNSTVGVHARLMGYPTSAAEPHGWAHMDIDELAAQERTPQELRDGSAWRAVRQLLGAE